MLTCGQQPAGQGPRGEGLAAGLWWVVILHEREVPGWSVSSISEDEHGGIPLQGLEGKAGGRAPWGVRHSLREARSKGWGRSRGPLLG